MKDRHVRTFEEKQQVNNSCEKQTETFRKYIHKQSIWEEPRAFSRAEIIIDEELKDIEYILPFQGCYLAGSELSGDTMGGCKSRPTNVVDIECPRANGIVWVRYTTKEAGSQDQVVVQRCSNLCTT